MNEQQAKDEYALRLFMVLYGPESWSPLNPKPEHMIDVTWKMVDRFRCCVEDGPIDITE